jgi:transcriptional regulator with XRE-family HTH domain
MRIDKNKLELAMARNCVSAEELGQQTGISTITIARIRNGSQMGRTKTIGTIAKALKVDVTEIIVNEGAATPNKRTQDSESNQTARTGGDYNATK